MHEDIIRACWDCLLVRPLRRASRGFSRKSSSRHLELSPLQGSLSSPPRSMTTPIASSCCSLHDDDMMGARDSLAHMSPMGSEGRQPAMSVLALQWGAGLIVFSPLSMLFILIVLRKPELVIIAILSAFAYLLALLFSAMIWIVVPPLQKVAFTTVLVGCACQLTSRIMLYRAYERTEYMIKSASHPHIIIPLNDITSSVASGVGYGLMHAIMLFGSVLASFESDPGVLYERSCGRVPLVLVLAFQGLAFSLLDLVLTWLVFLYLRTGQLQRIGLVFFMHLIAACTTIFNELDNGCNTSLPLLYASLVGSGMWMAHELRQR